MTDIEHAAEWFAKRAEITPMPGARRMFEIAAEVLSEKANGVSVNEWRPASEPPKNDYEKHWKYRQYYLVRLAPSGLMRVAKYGYKEHGWWVDSHDCVLCKERYTEVTHWMPLPSAEELQ